MSHPKLAAFAAPPLADGSPQSHRLVRAFRVAGLASGEQADPQPRLIELFGGVAQFQRRIRRRTDLLGQRHRVRSHLQLRQRRAGTCRPRR